jgi:putative transposase
MSYVKIWIHAVWGTKNHEPILSKDIRTKLFQHIRENAKEQKIYLDTINGYFDHVHCLLALNADMNTSEVLHLLKGESSFWANKNNLLKSKFDWANEYFAVSVSESMIDKVRNYIKGQENHHKNVTFKEEYDDFIKKYKFLFQG